MQIWKRIRGIVGTALSWAIPWSLTGVALAITTIVFGAYPGIRGILEFVGLVATFYGIWGAISGGIFAVVLAAAEHRRALKELTMGRVIAWGAVGSLIVPLLFVILLSRVYDDALIPSLPLFAIPAALGAVSAAGTLSLARRAEKQLAGRDVGSLTSA